MLLSLENLVPVVKVAPQERTARLGVHFQVMLLSQSQLLYNIEAQFLFRYLFTRNVLNLFFFLFFFFSPPLSIPQRQSELNISGITKLEQNIAQIPKIAAIKEAAQKQGNSWALCFLSLPSFYLHLGGEQSNLCSSPSNTLLIWGKGSMQGSAAPRELQTHAGVSRAL